MAERTRLGIGRLVPGNGGPLSSATTSAGRQFAWLVGRESVLRLGLSFVLATALWLYVSDKQNPGYIDFAQPLPISPNLPIGYTVTNNLPQVHIRYTTDNPSLGVTTTSFQASVNLSGGGAGTHVHVPVQVIADTGITTAKVSPAFVTVVVEQTLIKRIPVVAHYLELPGSNYNAGTAQVTPSTVTISGPRSLVSQVTQAAVDLNLAGQRSSVLELSKPLAADSQGDPVPGSSHLSLNPTEVQVGVPIHELASFKTVPLLVPIRGYPRTGVGVSSITVQPPVITAKGLPGLLARLSTISTQPISVTRHGAGQLVSHVRIGLPQGVSSSTAEVQVTIGFKPVDASSSTELAVTPFHVGPGLVAHIRPGKVLVTVLGPSVQLTNAAHGLSAVVDLTNFSAGIYTVTPRVAAHRGLVVGEVFPAQVQVTIVPAS